MDLDGVWNVARVLSVPSADEVRLLPGAFRWTETKSL
jgi:hypothetical protein